MFHVECSELHTCIVIERFGALAMHLLLLLLLLVCVCVCCLLYTSDAADER